MSRKRSNPGVVATVVAFALLCASLLGGQTLVVHHDGHDHDDDHAHTTSADPVAAIHHDAGGHTHVFSLKSDGTRLERASQLSQVAKPHLKQVASAFQLNFSLKPTQPVTIHGRFRTSHWTAEPPLIGTVGLRI
jgi:hypothetical protein